jgi:acyl-coenzyme A synthetase/AMP-(fatty) acid ligase
MNLAEQALRSTSGLGNGDAPAFLTAAGPITRAEVEQAAIAVAGGLRLLGIGRGDKVLLRMTNSGEFAAAFLGAVWAGSVPVLQNFQFGLRELEHIAALSRPSVVLYATLPKDQEPLVQLLPGAAHAVVAREGLRLTSGDLAGNAATTYSQPVDARADEAAFIVFTSGTTGKPKGVVHAHRWLNALGDSNRARIPPKAGDVVLATGEWSFISALGHNVLFRFAMA